MIFIYQSTESQLLKKKGLSSVCLRCRFNGKSQKGVSEKLQIIRYI